MTEAELENQVGCYITVEGYTDLANHSVTGSPWNSVNNSLFLFLSSYALLYRLHDVNDELVKNQGYSLQTDS